MPNKSVQGSLFNHSADLRPSYELSIKKTTKRALSKNEKKFNKLVQRVEQLDHQIKKYNLLIEGYLNYYLEQVLPVETDKNLARNKLIKLLFSVYQAQKKNRTFLTKSEIKSLHNIISLQLGNFVEWIRDESEIDAELNNIFKIIEGVPFDQIKHESFDEAKADLQEYFEIQGFDIDLKDMDLNMSDEETAVYLKKLEKTLKAQQESLKYEKEKKDASKKKTRKQIENEALAIKIEEAKSKSINTIYRQLAKILHPDLEQDEVLKSEKAKVMQDVTQAYQEKNLPALLRLELTWINKEKLLDIHTDDNLLAYHELLKEQIERLEAEKKMILLNPRYMLLQKYIPGTDDIPDVNWLKIKNDAIAIAESIHIALTDLAGNQQAITLKNMIHEYKRMYEYSTKEAGSPWDEYFAR